MLSKLKSFFEEIADFFGWIFANPFPALVDSRVRQMKAAKPLPTVQECLVKGICPDCGGNKWFMGPQGGMCQNIKCSNPDCGSRFNCGPFEDGQWLGQPLIADRIGD